MNEIWLYFWMVFHFVLDAICGAGSTKGTHPCFWDWGYRTPGFFTVSSNFLSSLVQISQNRPHYMPDHWTWSALNSISAGPLTPSSARAFLHILDFFAQRIGRRMKCGNGNEAAVSPLFGARCRQQHCYQYFVVFFSSFFPFSLSGATKWSLKSSWDLGSAVSSPPAGWGSGENDICSH